MYMSSSECNFIAMLTRMSSVWVNIAEESVVDHRVQLQCKVYEEGGKYTKALPRSTCPSYESTLHTSRWSPCPVTLDFMLVHWRFCYCKKVKIEWAELISNHILDSNAVRVSEHMILPKDAWWSTEEVEHFNSQGVRTCPLYLCCSRISLNITLHHCCQGMPGGWGCRGQSGEAFAMYCMTSRNGLQFARNGLHNAENGLHFSRNGLHFFSPFLKKKMNKIN